MYSNNTANNYDCTPLLTSDKDEESDANHIDPVIDNKSWFRRVFDSTPFLEKSLSTIRSTGLFQESRDSGQSGSNSDCQCNNSCGQQYGANGGYTCNCNEKMNVSDQSRKTIRIYWRFV